MQARKDVHQKRGKPARIVSVNLGIRLTELTFAPAKSINFFMTCDALTQPTMNGISCPVESMVLTPRMSFQRIVYSMLAMNQAMLRMM